MAPTKKRTFLDDDDDEPADDIERFSVNKEYAKRFQVIIRRTRK